MNRPRERREFDDIEQGKDAPTERGASIESVPSQAGASAENVPDESDPHTEKQLDHGLKETFPASDPVSINPGAD